MFVNIHNRGLSFVDGVESDCMIMGQEYIEYYNPKYFIILENNNTFEFKKDRKNQKFNLDNYLRNFIIQNLSIDNISHSSNGNVSR